MSGVVEYLVAIRGTVDKSIEQAMKSIGASASNMAKQVNAAEASINRAGKAQAAQAAATAAAVERSQKAQIAAMAAADRQRKNSIAETNRWYASNGKSAAAEEKALAKQIAMQERANAAAQKAAAKRNSFFGGGGHGGGEGVMGNLMTAGIVGYMGVHAAKGMVHFVDHAGDRALEVAKLKMVGFKGHLLDEADKVATEMSRRYGNLSKTDILRQLHEGVGVYGSAKESLENVEFQTRLESFLQAFEGGKHAGKGREFARESMAAIKSMEMENTLNEHDETKRKAMVRNVLDGMLGMKVMYGENAKLAEYKTMMQRGSQAIRDMSDDFKRTALPALIQERGGNVTGTSIQTAWQTMNGIVQLSASQQRELGKYGLLKGSGKQARVSDALRDAFNYDPTTAAEMIRNAVAAKLGVDPNSDAGRAALKNADMPGIIGRMLRNRRAAGLFGDLLGGDQNIERHRNKMREILATMKEIDDAAQGKVFSATTWGGAKASVAKQFENLMTTLSGPLLQPALAGLNQLSTKFHDWSSGLETFFANNPDVASKVGTAATWGTGLLAGAAVLAAVGFVFKVLRSGIGALGLGRAASGMLRLTMGAGKLGGALAKAALFGGRLRMLTGIGAGLAIGAAIYQNWDKLAASFERVAKSSDKIKQIGKEYDRLGEWARETEVGKAVRKGLKLDMDIKGGKGDFDPMFSGAGQWNNRYSNWIARNYRNPAMVGGPGFGDDVQRFWNAGPSAPGGGAGANVANAQAQRVQVESRVQVNTQFSPVTIQPGTLTVQYNGPIGGPGSVPVNGSGGHPRGEALPATSTTAGP